MSLLASLWREGWLRNVDHALALSLRHAREETSEWVLVAAALASRALGNGHSRLPLARSDELFAEIDATRDAPALPPIEDWLAMLAVSPWVLDADRHDETSHDPAGVVLVLEGDAIALRRYHDYECRLASALLERAKAGSRLQLLTGGPGTGKTTQVARLMVQFSQSALPTSPTPPRILLAAPTGKAASRLSESVRESLARQVDAGDLDAALAGRLPTQASTLHRMLGWQRGGGFRHDHDHPLPADLVIVDEASMVDLPMMCRLVEAVAPQALLVLVGDRDQLPSVETGDVLAALCEASEAAGSPLSGSRTHLTHSHRQGEDVDVPQLARLVRDGDADGAIAGLANNGFRGVSWRSEGDHGLHDGLLAQALPAYRSLLDAPDVASALQRAREFRVLCAVREGLSGSATINALVSRALDPLRGGQGWFRGRLLLVTENSYRQQLFNGDIGIAWPDEQGQMRAWFDTDDGPRAWLPAAIPAHESAFAMTVHKAQGSEFGEVAFVLPERGARVISRELVYTGLTRCRRAVTLWATESVLREGIARRAQRWSGLAERLGAT
ncbi:MAG: exodeoxyribonuclease V subunit alpha [Gammaproteobacteria bacterium]|nr:exodeoxyribonuclease V subunit alpha [Gammaproteobacteria bacterium]